MTHKTTALIAGGIILVSIIVHIETYKHLTKRYNAKFEYLQEYIANQDSVVNNTLDTVYHYKVLCNEYSETIDSLTADVFIKEYKLRRIKEYCDIVKKDQTQQKFLRGWVMRVLDY